MNTAIRSVAKYALPFLTLLLFSTVAGCGSSPIKITHQAGQLPEIDIGNAYVDKTKLKVKKDQVTLDLKWKTSWLGS